MPINEVRAFNRFYTNLIGALDYSKHRYTPYTLTESRVLYELAHSPRTDAADLRAELSLDAGYLSRMLAKFERDGLVGRAPSEVDPRRQRITLTPRGREAAALLDERSREAVGALLENVATDERPRLVEAMRTVRQILSRARTAHREDRCCASPGPVIWGGSCSGTVRCTPPSTAGTPTSKGSPPGSSRTSRKTTTPIWSGCGSPSWTGGRSGR